MNSILLSLCAVLSLFRPALDNLGPINCLLHNSSFPLFFFTSGLSLILSSPPPTLITTPTMVRLADPLTQVIILVSNSDTLSLPSHPLSSATPSPVQFILVPKRPCDPLPSPVVHAYDLALANSSSIATVVYVGFHLLLLPWYVQRFERNRILWS